MLGTAGTSINTSRPVSSYNGAVDYGSTVKLPTVAIEEIDSFGDEEKGPPLPESLARPVQLTSSIFVGLGVCLVIVLAFGFATSKLVIESMVDGKLMRMALVAALPLLMLVGLYL
jgi:hypothetical protein